MMRRKPAVNFRNTPTGVGKTVLAQKGATGDQKHPHGRGEDVKKA